MGMIETEITLRSLRDNWFAREGYIKPEEVRTATVTAVVDTGATTLVINEEIRKALGLEVDHYRTVTLADGSKRDFAVTEPVTVVWKNRDAVCKAYVAPNASTVLLGAIPLEEMDLIISPLKQELVGAHGDEPTGFAL